MQFTEAFDLADLDDDGRVEFVDSRDHFVRIDINGDGQLTEEEMVGDSAGEDLPPRLFNIIDFNRDEKVTFVDFELFHFALEFGNDMDLGEYLEYCISKADLEESGITVKAYLRARRNYLVMDIDDNLKVSEQEFRSQFRVADFDKSGTLTTFELNAFKPIRFVDVTDYCSESNAGYTLDMLLNLFYDADTDEDSFLTMTEYLARVGTLTAST
ncbi:hypothetical protein SNE40_022492 [Patella caerulea]|uniref:EF-hand domain-containing protein n=1 Tax=Patella caerulea TaxID=87958 RepID=A0AAN8G8B1_PATCE